MDDHAQLEIRSYANVIGHEIVGKWCPLTWEAFNDYRLEAMQLSRIEADILRLLLKRDFQMAVAVAIKEGLIDKNGAPGHRSRERDELEAKLEKLGLAVPWKVSRIKPDR